MPSSQVILDEVRRGQGIRAKDFNSLTGQIQQLSSFGNGINGIANAAGKFVGNPQSTPCQPDFILLKNTTGADLTGWHSVLAIGAPLVLPSEVEGIIEKNPIAFEGVSPQADRDEGRFAVLWGPVPPNGFQIAVVSGGCWVKLSVDSDDDKFADIEDGETSRLKTSATGSASIFWKEPSGDEPWAIVRLSRRAG